MANTNGRRPNTKILVLSRSEFGASMSSPGIRTRHMVEVLSQELPEAEVTLGLMTGSEHPGDLSKLPYRVVHYKSRTLPRLLFEHDIIIANDFPPIAMSAFPWKTYVLDYYTVYFLEWMEMTRDSLNESKRRRDLYMSGARRRVGAEL